MNIFILAGEPSGDEYGAELIKQMQSQNPEIQFHGIGGPLMEQYGLKSMVDFNQMSVMGFVEILKSIGFFIALENKIVRFIEEHSFDKIVLIDYPGLNLRLCQKIKQKTNCEIFYYISPQIWAWKEKRVETIRTYVDYMLDARGGAKVLPPLDRPFAPSTHARLHATAKTPELKTELKPSNTFAGSSIRGFA